MYREILDRNTELVFPLPGDAEELFALVDCERDRLAKWLTWLEQVKSLEDPWGDGDGMSRLPPQPPGHLDQEAAPVLEPEVPAGGIVSQKVSSWRMNTPPDNAFVIDRRPDARYRPAHEDSSRWDGFVFYPGDIVISTRSRSGTTWMQMICALLIFQTPDLPAPLAELSPWMEWLSLDRDKLLAGLASQEHRRFIKTHTPLDGLPLDPRVTYVVVARHPLDMAVSLYHHYANLDVRRLNELAGQPDTGTPKPLPSLREWLLSWVAQDCDPYQRTDPLVGVMHHVADAWSRRAESNIILVHYDDLAADLEGQMRELAERLSIAVPASSWPDLVNAATFSSMRSRAERFTPGPPGVFLDDAAFFREGRSGAGDAVLTPEELSLYRARVAEMASPEVVSWLHRDAGTSWARQAVER
jgi:aryl sulfotransferase